MSKGLWILLVTTTIQFALGAKGQGLSNESAYDLVEKDTEGSSFRSGSTNAPLLAMDWLAGHEWMSVAG